MNHKLIITFKINIRYALYGQCLHKKGAEVNTDVVQAIVLTADTSTQTKQEIIQEYKLKGRKMRGICNKNGGGSGGGGGGRRGGVEPNID